MLTRSEFDELQTAAMRRYDRMRDCCPEEIEVAFAVSRDVFGFMCTEEAMNVRIEQTFYLRRQNGIIGLFDGIKVYIINEETDEPVFWPVMCDMAYYNGMALEDIILISDGHLYKLQQIEPQPMFTDTGFTVSGYEVIDETATVYATTNANTDAVDALTYAGVPANDYAGDAATVAAVDGVDRVELDGVALDFDFGREIRLDPEELNRIVDAFIRTPREATFAATTADIHLNAPLFEQLAGVGIAPKRKKRKKAVDEELNPGNTKMIDDFLNGFVRSGA